LREDQFECGVPERKSDENGECLLLVPRPLETVRLRECLGDQSSEGSHAPEVGRGTANSRPNFGLTTAHRTEKYDMTLLFLSSVILLPHLDDAAAL